MWRQRSAPVSLRGSGWRAKIGAIGVNADDLKPVEQEHQPHAISNRLSGAVASAPNTSRADQPAAIASPAHRSRNAPAASTIRCHRSAVNPAGGAMQQRAAYPSAHDRGTLAPYSIRAARSTLSGDETNEFNELTPAEEGVCS